MREIRAFGTFRLDLQARRLERAGGPDVPLGAKAFDVLALLVAHAGEPIPRKMLLDTVWAGRVVEENNLTQAISALRRALGEGYIVTLPGRGYQFVAEVRRAPEALLEGDGATSAAPTPAGQGERAASVPREPPSRAPPSREPPSREPPSREQPSRAPPSRAPPSRVLRRTAVAGLVVAALVGIGAVLWLLTRPPAEPFIVVLPFVNLSSDPAQQYFADGLSDHLRNQLAEIDGLRVTGRTSSIGFGNDMSLRDIGRELGVDAAIEGTVQMSEDRARIHVGLVDVAGGHYRLSKTYPASLDEPFAVQDEIARDVLAALRPALGIAEPSRDYGGTEVFEAFDHLLRGLAQQTQFTPEALRNAAEELRRAVAIDPGYGQAWAELAFVLAQLTIVSPEAREQLLPERREAARQARETAPDLPMTQIATGWLAYDERDWQTHAMVCDRVLADPAGARAQAICSGGNTSMGYVRAALPYRQAAASTDPLAPSVTITLARHYALLGMHAAVERVYEIFSTRAPATWQRNEPLVYSLMNERVSHGELAKQLEPLCAGPDAPVICRDLVEALAAPGEVAPQLRGMLEVLGETKPQDTYVLALFAAYFDDPDLALDALEVFTAAAPPALYQHLWYPILRDARANPRFNDLMREIGFADYWRSTDRWSDYCKPTDEDDFVCR